MNYDLSKIRIKCAEIIGKFKFIPTSNYVLIYKLNGEEEQLAMRYFPTDAPAQIGLCLDLAGVPQVTKAADAALDLVEWMAKPENGAYLWFADSVTNRPKYTVSFISRKNATQATADTFPLALCLAFLKANGINPEAL